MFTTEGDARTYAQSTTAPNLNQSDRTYDYLASLGGRYRFWDGSLALNTMAESGAAGHRYGGDLSGRKQFDGGYYDALACSPCTTGTTRCAPIAARPAFLTCSAVGSRRTSWASAGAGSGSSGSTP